MLKVCAWIILAGWAAGARGERIDFDWSKDATGKCPPGFASQVTGPGKPAEWTVIELEVPPLLAPLSPNARASVTKRAVLAAQSPDVAAEHCPVLLFKNEIFTDFTLTTRFKIAGGIVEPMAGVVFRAQDESNYYVARASTAGNLLWYRVVGGKAYDMLGVGVKVAIPKDEWMELRVECAGSRIRCYLDGKLMIPPAQAGAPTENLAINDTTFSSGKIGFWTKADTRCYFVDAQVRYTPKVPFVQEVVTEVARKYPAIQGLKIYANRSAGPPVIIGAPDEHDLGTAGGKVEADTIARGSIYYLKTRKAVEVTLPLRDRNGDIAAALWVRMRSFPGETQATAVNRATVVKKEIEERIATLQEVTE
jgi:hypothetical protein